MTGLDPMRDIEDRKAQNDLGAFGFRIFEGACNDGAPPFEALLVVAAFAMIHGGMGNAE